MKAITLRNATDQFVRKSNFVVNSILSQFEKKQVYNNYKYLIVYDNFKYLIFIAKIQQF